MIIEFHKSNSFFIGFGVIFVKINDRDKLFDKESNRIISSSSNLFIGLG